MGDCAMVVFPVKGLIIHLRCLCRTHDCTVRHESNLIALGGGSLVLATLMVNELTRILRQRRTERASLGYV